MADYILRRLLYLVPVMLLVTVLVFSLLHIAGGDPAALMLGVDATPSDIARVQRELGLDRPLYEQYLTWLGRAAQGDLGRSIQPVRYRVSDLILQGMPVTVQLALQALLLSLAIGIPLGVLAGRKRGSRLDLLALNISAWGISIPSFLLGLILIFLFSLALRWAPSMGYVPPLKDFISNLRYMILPTITLSTYLTAIVVRMTRSSVLEAMSQDFIITARAKGLRELLVVRRHALKVALIPVVTVVGLQFGHILGGSVVIEYIFALPGLGRLTIDAVYARDFPVVQGAVLVMSIGFVLVNLAVDLLYGYLDPRIKYR